MKVLHRTLCVLIALAGLAALPAAASADTGSYTATAWNGPNIYNARMWINGGVITPPAGIPANATITSISGSFNWNMSAPYPYRYEGRVCDYADGEHNVSPVFATGKGCTPFGQSYYSSWAVNNNTAYAGKPAATTQIYFSARLNDGGSTSTYPPVSPYRYLTSKSITVNYQYTP